MSKTLKDLKPGQKGVVLNLGKKGPVRKRLMDMGITPGAFRRSNRSKLKRIWIKFKKRWSRTYKFKIVLNHTN